MKRYQSAEIQKEDDRVIKNTIKNLIEEKYTIDRLRNIIKNLDEYSARYKTNHRADRQLKKAAETLINQILI